MHKTEKVKTADQKQLDSKCPSCGNKIYCLVCSFYVDCPSCESRIKSQTTQELIREIEKHSLIRRVRLEVSGWPIAVIREIDESWWQQFRKDKGVK